jgi:hypothetical protein
MAPTASALSEVARSRPASAGRSRFRRRIFAAWKSMTSDGVTATVAGWATGGGGGSTGAIGISSADRTSHTSRHRAQRTSCPCAAIFSSSTS